MLDEFQQWLTANVSRLAWRGIACTPGAPSLGVSNCSIHCDLASDTHEATVIVWESGESDFHVLDRRQDTIQVTSHEFTRSEDLVAALDGLGELMAEGVRTRADGPGPRDSERSAAPHPANTNGT